MPDAKIDIEKLFHIDLDNPRPCYQQLRDKLVQFIEANPPGMRLPAERDIALALKLNRGTVKKAIESLVAAGKLVRNGYKGTFTAGGKPAATGQFHPILMDAFHLESPQKPLKFCLYENTKLYKEFWLWAVDAFNQSGTGCRVAIDWLPSSVASDQLAAYVRDTKPDIVQISLSSEMEDLLAPLPETFSAALADNATHWSECLGGDVIRATRRAAPVHLTSMGYFWNAGMAAKHGLGETDALARGGDAIGAICRAARALPEGVRASGNVWDWFVSLGLPGTADGVDVGFFSERFERLSELRGLDNGFITRQSYSMEAFDLFAAERLFLYVGNLSFVQHQRDCLPFALKFEFCVPEQDYTLPCSLTALGAYQDSPRRDGAFEFLRFVLSEPVQRHLAEREVGIAYRRDANAALLRPGSHAAKSVAAVRNVGFTKRNLAYLVIFRIRDVFHDLMRGIITPATAAKMAFERWREYEKE